VAWWKSYEAKKLFRKSCPGDNMEGAGAVPPVYPGLINPASEGFPQSSSLPWLHERKKEMRDSVRRCKETFLRTQAFGRENFPDADRTTFVGRQLAAIDSVLAGLDSHAGAQAAGVSAARQGTLGKDAALAKLLGSLVAIRRTARPMAANDPTLLQQFRVPYGQSVQGVLAVAVSVATAARQLKAEFVQRGLPETFVEELEADTDALREAVTRKIENRRAHVTATAAIRELCERGMKALRELDPFMRNTYAAEPARLAAWLSASRVERRAARARTGEQPPAPPNSPAPGTPAPTPAG
jgi:hypothetical protein